MAVIFGDFDAAHFWRDSEHARAQYEDEWPSDADVAAIQSRLGVALPRAYVALARTRNGGMPHRTCHRVAEPTSWAPDHVTIAGIFSIGARKRFGLCGEHGSAFWTREWGYPPIGVYFADCPSAGHDMLGLDYRACGPAGEPPVVHVDQERGFRITAVAASFEAFIRNLRPETDFGG